MPKQIGAGDLTERVTFAKQGEGNDGGGGVETTFADQFTRWAHFSNAGGGEAVRAARLEGRTTFTVIVRSDSQTRLITADWRMQDARRGTLYQIRSVNNVTDRFFVYLTVEAGVA